MTRDAWDIVNRQPRSGQYIFPYKPRSIGIAFSRACMVLGVTELTFDYVNTHASAAPLAHTGMNPDSLAAPS